MKFICLYHCSATTEAGIWLLEIWSEFNLSYCSMVSCSSRYRTSYIRDGNGPIVSNWNSTDITADTKGDWNDISQGAFYFHCGTDYSIKYCNFEKCNSRDSLIHSWWSEGNCYITRCNFVGNNVSWFAIIFLNFSHTAKITIDYCNFLDNIFEKNVFKCTRLTYFTDSARIDIGTLVANNMNTNTYVVAGYVSGYPTIVGSTWKTEKITFFETLQCKAKIKYPEKSPIETPFNSPNKTPLETLYLTPHETPNITPFETNGFTPYTTPISTPYSTVENTVIETPRQTPIETQFSTPSDTIFDTPCETQFMTPYDTFSYTMYDTPLDTFSLTPFSTVISTPFQTLIFTLVETPVPTIDKTPSTTPLSSLDSTPFYTDKETAEMTPFNTEMETIFITPIATVSSTQLDTPFETLYQTPTITPSETLPMTPILTQKETIFMTPFFTLSKTQIPTLEETEHETPFNTPHLTAYKTAFATINETPIDTMHETPIDTMHETPIDTMHETPIDTIHETPIDTIHETPIDTIHETPIDTIHETPKITISETIAQTKIETISETPIETVYETISNTLIETLIAEGIHPFSSTSTSSKNPSSTIQSGAENASSVKSTKNKSLIWIIVGISLGILLLVTIFIIFVLVHKKTSNPEFSESTNEVEDIPEETVIPREVITDVTIDNPIFTTTMDDCEHSDPFNMDFQESTIEELFL